MDKHGLDWRTFADDGEIAKRWNSPATPAFYILDHQGVIRRQWIGHPGEETIQATLEQLLGQMSPREPPSRP